MVLGTATGADDVVQDADVRAWLARDRLDADRPFRPWYLRVVANAARNARRGRGRRAALELRSGRSTVEQLAPDPAERIVADEALQHALTALNGLRADDRLIIGLRYFEHLGERDVAEVLGCPAGTVKSRLSRALGRLRSELEAGRRHDGEEVR